MKRIFYIFTITALILNVNIVSGQKDNRPLGARSSGMGDASVTLTDFWSLHNNQAGLAKYDKISAGLHAGNNFLLPNLNTGAFGIVMPVKGAGVFGLSYNYFGFSLYNESKVGLAYAMPLGEKISAGIQLDYLRTFIGEDYGSSNVFTFETGLQAELIEKLILGIHVYNPIRAKLSKTTDERVPVIIKAGLSYTFSDKALVALETEKDIDQKQRIRTGIEYHLTKPVYIRAGIATNPFTNSFGIGLDFNNFKADISAVHHEVLGFSPQLSMIYVIKNSQ